MSAIASIPLPSGTLTLPPGQRVDGSIGHSSGNVTCEGDLTIEGNVLDGPAITAGGTVRVAGVVQAATVRAGRDLHVDGGIAGRMRAHCVAGGDLTARYVANATVDVTGAMTVLGEILNSQVSAGGNLMVEGGAIIGGRVSAGGSIACARLGAAGRPRTIIQAGVNATLEQAVRAAAEQIKSGRARVHAIRTVIAPLLKDQKRLTPQQKEKATELLFEADEIDRAAAASVAELTSRGQAFAATANPLVRVSEAIFAGVTLRLEDFEGAVDDAVKGPLTVSLHGHGGDRHIRLTDDAGGVIVLRTRKIAGVWALLRKEAA